MESHTGGEHITQKYKKRTGGGQPIEYVTGGGQPIEYVFQVFEYLGVGLTLNAAPCFIHGLVNTPAGTATEIVGGGLQAVRRNAAHLPFNAGRFAVFCCMTDGFERTLAHARGVEDYWNFVGAIAPAAALLNCRMGLRVSVASALFAGAVAASVKILL